MHGVASELCIPYFFGGWTSIHSTLWWTNILPWKMAIEIVDFPIKNGDFPWQNVSSPEGPDTSPHLKRGNQKGQTLHLVQQLSEIGHHTHLVGFLVKISTPSSGCVWKCCVPHCTQWFVWSLSLLNGYNWEYTLFSDKPISRLWSWTSELMTLSGPHISSKLCYLYRSIVRFTVFPSATHFCFSSEGACWDLDPLHPLPTKHNDSQIEVTPPIIILVAREIPHRQHFSPTVRAYVSWFDSLHELVPPIIYLP